MTWPNIQTNLRCINAKNLVWVVDIRNYYHFMINITNIVERRNYHQLFDKALFFITEKILSSKFYVWPCCSETGLLYGDDWCWVNMQALKSRYLICVISWSYSFWSSGYKICVINFYTDGNPDPWNFTARLHICWSCATAIMVLIENIFLIFQTWEVSLFFSIIYDRRYRFFVINSSYRFFTLIPKTSQKDYTNVPVWLLCTCIMELFENFIFSLFQTWPLIPFFNKNLWK